jgi:diadenosine tetraphosphate (Ap4A) HIT family hydrolase
MMVDPHVHFHDIPRYQGERSGCGVTVSDAGWPRAPALEKAVAHEPPQIRDMVSWLKGFWSGAA